MMSLLHQPNVFLGSVCIQAVAWEVCTAVDMSVLAKRRYLSVPPSFPYVCVLMPLALFLCMAGKAVSLALATHWVFQLRDWAAVPARGWRSGHLRRVLVLRACLRRYRALHQQPAG